MEDKICAIKDKIVQRIDSEIMNRGMDRIDVEELGEMIDMVKDLAEAEDHCKQAKYYETVTKAMNQEDSSYNKGFKTGYTSNLVSKPMDYHETLDSLRSMMEHMDPTDKEHLTTELQSMIK